jgi:hypothetical protein
LLVNAIKLIILEGVFLVLDCVNTTVFWYFLSQEVYCVSHEFLALVDLYFYHHYVLYIVYIIINHSIILRLAPHVAVISFLAVEIFVSDSLLVHYDGS